MIGRRFLQRCGMLLEAVLRKHRVINRRNRNSALYVVLNTEWPEAQHKLKVYLGLPLKVLKHRIAEIGDVDLPSQSKPNKVGSIARSGSGCNSHQQIVHSAIVTSATAGSEDMQPLSSGENSKNSTKRRRKKKGKGTNVCGYNNHSSC